MRFGIVEFEWSQAHRGRRSKQSPRSLAGDIMRLGCGPGHLALAELSAPGQDDADHRSYYHKAAKAEPQSYRVQRRRAVLFSDKRRRNMIWLTACKTGLVLSRSGRIGATRSWPFSGAAKNTGKKRGGGNIDRILAQAATSEGGRFERTFEAGDCKRSVPAKIRHGRAIPAHI